MHESTVSRVTKNKWVHTPQGLFELKFFFSNPINKTDGDSVSSESVREHIRNIIKSENALEPYSDQEIIEILKKLNIEAARRTVAKYRESIGILPSRMRKKRINSTKCFTPLNRPQFLLSHHPHSNSQQANLSLITISNQSSESRQ